MSPNSEDGEARFREPKTVYEELKLVENLFLANQTCTRTKLMGGNKFWRMANFTVLYNFRFRSGGLFKDYDLHKVAQPSTSMEEINAVNLNYLFCLFIKFVTEVAEKSRERFSLRLTEAKTGNTLRTPPGGGVLLGILVGGMPPGSSNPDPISDLNMPFSSPVFRPDL